MKGIAFIVTLAMVSIIAGCGEEDDGTGIELIQIFVSPDTVTISFGDSVQFHADVFNTPNRDVVWSVNDVTWGNDSLGTIDTSGLYISPLSSFIDSVTFDMLTIRAISQADTSRSDSALIMILDPLYVFVDSARGDDQTGIGSIVRPYRTISKGIEEAAVNQTVKVGEGTYFEGEQFPLTPKFMVTIQGEGPDKTRIAAPSTTDTLSAAFRIRNDLSEVENLRIVGENGLGIGVHFSSDTISTELSFRNSIIDSCYIAAVATGPSRTVNFEDNEVMSSTYGLVATNGGYFLVRRCSFNYIDSIAMKIEFDAFANLGQSVSPGDNTFNDCGLWCVYNADDDTISAQFNWWPSTDTITIDTMYIYDDDENAASGAVIFVPINP